MRKQELGARMSVVAMRIRDACVQRVHRHASHQLRQQPPQCDRAIEEIEADDASVEDEESPALALDRTERIDGAVGEVRVEREDLLHRTGRRMRAQARGLLRDISPHPD